MKGLRHKTSGKYLNNDFQSGFSSVSQALQVIGKKDANPEDWELVDVSSAEISSLLPIGEPPVDLDVEKRFSNIEKRLDKIEGK